jgi:2-polyprenyl-6-methoxyphenol hydroxylase-like FAD-dependent oxidoreductase
MNNHDYDVLIAGGGVGGCATALMLRTHAPSLTIALVEASHYEKPRLGETLAPLAKGLLQALGVWDAFQQQQPRASYGTAALWGAPIRYTQESIEHVHGPGWQIDRQRFDALLATEAANRGAQLILDTSVKRAAPQGAGWQVDLARSGNSPNRVRARFLVDATGRWAGLARAQGAQVTALDQLIGYARFYTENTVNDPRPLVEAFADGWWYSAGLPNQQRVVLCMSDRDIARTLRLHDLDQWQQLLATTSQIQATLHNATVNSHLMARACESRWLAPVVGHTWLVVGDAAAIFDPLSAQGITKALRAGIFAAYAIGDWLVKGVASGLARYQRFVQSEFASYQKARTAYYQAEARWPEHTFWRRRRQS